MNLEPERDRELSEALRRLEGEARLDEAAWNRLHARIAADARRRAAKPAEAATWWECLAGWSRAAVPLAAAVGVLFLVLTRNDWDPESAAPAAAEERAGLAMILSGEVQEQEAIASMVGPSDRDWLIASLMEAPSDE